VVANAYVPMIQVIQHLFLGRPVVQVALVVVLARVNLIVGLIIILQIHIAIIMEARYKFIFNIYVGQYLVNKD